MSTMDTDFASEKHFFLVRVPFKMSKYITSYVDRI